MSYEIRIGWPCSHLILEEPTFLSADRRSLGTKAPVANQDSVQILVDDKYYIPQTGFYSQALLTGSRSAPFQIQTCSGLAGPDANLLTISSSSGSLEVRLPEGDSVSLKEVLKAIRSANVNEVVAVGSYNGAVRLLDNAAFGSASFLRVGGAGADALGWEVQKGTRGKMLYPPWKLHTEREVYPSPQLANALTVVSRYPVFQAPIKGHCTFKISYVSTPERCPRCNATYVENDYRFDALGQPILIYNEDVLYQSCLKILLTSIGSNPFHPLYGTRLMDSIGQKRFGDAAVALKAEIQKGLNKVKTIQKQLREYQSLSLREQLYSVVSVDVAEGDDPTTFLVSCIVQSASGKPIRLSIAYTAPGATALAGSNGQTLGLNSAGLGQDQGY